jgi:hypothetical protein
MADKLLQIIGMGVMCLFLLCVFIAAGFIAIQGLGILVGIAGALLGVAIPVALIVVPVGLLVWGVMKLFSHKCPECGDQLEEHY